MESVMMIYAFGLFFAGVYCLNRYSASFSNKRISPVSSKSHILSFLKSFSISAIAGTPMLMTYSAASFCRAGILDFKTAWIYALGTIGCISSCFLVIIDNKTVIYLLLGLGGIMIFFLRKSRYENFKTLFFFIFSIGLLLYGMEEMKEIFIFSRADNKVINIITGGHNSLLIFCFGGIVSLLLQSTSATAFIAIGFFGGNVFTHDQTVWFIYGGICLGSAVRNQLIAFSFSGSARRLLAMNSNKIFIVSIIIVILYSIQIYAGIPMINQFLRNIYDNLIFEVYGAIFIVEFILILISSFFINQLIKIYEKIYPDELEETMSKAVFITKLELKPKNEWLLLIEKEIREILRKFYKILEEYIALKDIRLVNNVYAANIIIIEQMLGYHKKLHKSDSNLFAYGETYEKLLILERLNNELKIILNIVNTSAEKILGDKIVDAIIQHIHLIFMELSNHETNSLEYISEFVKEILPRKEIIESEFKTLESQYSKDIKLEFIISYYSILHYLREFTNSCLKCNQIK